MVKLTRTSILSGVTQTLELNCSDAQFEQGIKAYNAGALLQDAFPFLTAGEREFVKTGITPTEWDVMFGGDEDE